MNETAEVIEIVKVKKGLMWSEVERTKVYIVNGLVVYVDPEYGVEKKKINTK